ncbi:MAG: hypothetical protein WC455_17875 [Dehalococcoidia bacterium]
MAHNLIKARLLTENEGYLIKENFVFLAPRLVEGILWTYLLMDMLDMDRWLFVVYVAESIFTKRLKDIQEQFAILAWQIGGEKEERPWRYRIRVESV